MKNRNATATLEAWLQQTGLVVFDMDGTLYRQQLLRARMMAEMARILPWSAPGRRAIHIIADFRRVREALAESEAQDVLSQQYQRVASRLGVRADEVRRVTTEWLEQRPLRHLRRCREPGVTELFGVLRECGIRIAVLSDYPATEKLGALELSADISVAATDPEVNRFKPHPWGLQRVLELSGHSASECLVIGDRADRDGECASRLGARFLHKVGFRPNAPHQLRTFAELTSAVRRLSGSEVRPTADRCAL